MKRESTKRDKRQHIVCNGAPSPPRKRKQQSLSSSQLNEESKTTISTTIGVGSRPPHPPSLFLFSTLDKTAAPVVSLSLYLRPSPASHQVGGGSASGRRRFKPNYCMTAERHPPQVVQYPASATRVTLLHRGTTMDSLACMAPGYFIFGICNTTRTWRKAFLPTRPRTMHGKDSVWNWRSSCGRYDTYGGG